MTLLSEILMANAEWAPDDATQPYPPLVIARWTKDDGSQLNLNGQCPMDKSCRLSAKYQWAEGVARLQNPNGQSPMDNR